ncbi:hypothetical protein CC86DRAFT_414318, partial [Ophiobolus disseminans]
PRRDNDGNVVDGDNECLRIMHADKTSKEAVKDQKYEADGEQYVATGAYFDFALNLKGGGIIALNFESSSIAVTYPENWGRKAEPNELPNFRFLSNIYWGYWYRSNPNVKNLRVYAAYNVVNDATSELVVRAFKSTKVEKLTPWPGASFDIDSEEGQALVGSPIGATAAHVLSGHKEELGIEHVTKVTVLTNDYNVGFLEPKRKELHMFFTIEDAPGGEGGAGRKRRAVREDRAVREETSVRNEGKNVVHEHVFRVAGRAG